MQLNLFHGLLDVPSPPPPNPNLKNKGHYKHNNKSKPPELLNYKFWGRRRRIWVVMVVVVQHHVIPLRKNFIWEKTKENYFERKKVVVSSGRLVLQLVSDSLDKYLACVLNFCTPSLSSMESSLTDISLSLSLSLSLCLSLSVFLELRENSSCRV
jgi:hypothetical protein